MSLRLWDEPQRHKGHRDEEETRISISSPCPLCLCGFNTGAMTRGLANSAEEFLRLLEEALVHGGVFLTHERGKFLELLALLGIEARGHFHGDAHDEVATGMGTQRGNALAAQLEGRAAL